MVGDYQSVGTALDDSGYFVITGTHKNDDPFEDGATDHPATFPTNSGMGVFHYALDAMGRPTQDLSTAIRTPGAGDWQISPSSRLVVGRFGNADQQTGYTVRMLALDTTGGVARASLANVGTVCSHDASGGNVFSGNKAMFSYDERFITTQHYDDANGSADVYVYDLRTQRSIRVTRSPRGVLALFPHFRADGWLYFTVRDRNAKLGDNPTDYIVASDAALWLAKNAAGG
jgi:hypothetical protein